MMKRSTIHFVALGLGLVLAAESFTADVLGGEETSPPGASSTAAGYPPPVFPTVPGFEEGSGTKTELAAASKRPRRRVRPRRRRRRQAPLRLPAITPYGIPRLHVKAAYVVDATNNRVLFQKNPERVLPVASLTKLVTAMIFLQTHPDWDRIIEIVPQDVWNSSRTRIRPREEITVRDLIHAALISSDNAATKALVRTCGVAPEEFLRRMNALTDSLGLSGTRFVEPTGLSERNVSTAQDMARILRVATDSDVVTEIMQKTEYRFVSNRRLHRLVNTNRLLRSQWNITGGKTGFIRESGYCLATNVKAPTGIDITAVVLGAPSNALRFAEARRILDWTFRFGLALPESQPETH